MGTTSVIALMEESASSGRSSNNNMPLYCIEVTRELEDKEVIHVEYDHEPTRDEVIELVRDAGFHYDDDYGKLRYYPVVAKEVK